MPRPRQTEQQRREKLLLATLAKASVENDLAHDKDVANFLNLDVNTYRYRKRAAFQRTPLEDFARMARMLRFSGREVCTMLGVPYEDMEG